MSDHPGRGNCTVSLPALAEAGVAVCLATILARAGPGQKQQPSYSRIDLDYRNQDIAYAAAQGQLACYRRWESLGWLSTIRSAEDLAAHWQNRNAEHKEKPLGVILSMEGCDPIVAPEQVEDWWDDGLRAAGLTHYGEGQYAFGTGIKGPLKSSGIALLKEFERLGIALDVTHLSDEGMAQALDLFEGNILASHHNCRALVPHQRQLTDGQIRQLIGREAVIGAAFDAWMLAPGWVKGRSDPASVTLDHVAQHIDRVCQIAGNARHSAIGSDLDGGFGKEQTPGEVDTVADLQRLAGALEKKGFDGADIDAVFHGNWLRFFGKALPSRRALSGKRGKRSTHN